MHKLYNIAVGFQVPPYIVAGFRGLVMAFIGGLVTLALSYVTSDAVPKEYIVYVPIAIYVLRQIEGVLDQKHDPAGNEMPALNKVTPTEAADIVREVRAMSNSKSKEVR